MYVDLLELLVATVLGGIIGWERESKGSFAGLRTHILVCLGSCLIMQVSIHMFDIYKGATPSDPGRIAAGVITGIGFLGAGAIMRSTQSIKGLTTAASIWIASGIGLAVGSGFYVGSVASTFITFLVLKCLHDVENKFISRNSKKQTKKTVSN